MALWFVAAFCAFLVKGVCGFANTLVFTSILSFGSANIEITPVDLFLGFPPNVIMAWRGRKKLKWRMLLPLVALIVSGDIAGAFLLKNVNSNAVRIVFGAAVAVVALDMLKREYYPPKKPGSKVGLAIIGVLSGVMSGLFGIAAMMVAYMSRMTKNSEEMKSHISAVFLTDNIARFILYLSMGILTLSSLKTALMLLPAALAGLFCGIKLSGKMPEKLTRLTVFLLLFLSGVVLILKSL